jgi:hypothetical protein
MSPLNPDSGFDPRRDVAPVGLVAYVQMVLSVGPRGGIRDLAGLLEHIRRSGERASFGCGGVGSTSHLAPAYLLHLTGLKATLVSYRGAGPAMNDLAAGVVDAVIDQTVTMIPAHRGGTAVALAGASPSSPRCRPSPRPACRASTLWCGTRSPPRAARRRPWSRGSPRPSTRRWGIRRWPGAWPTSPRSRRGRRSAGRRPPAR